MLLRGLSEKGEECRGQEEVILEWSTGHCALEGRGGEGDGDEAGRAGESDQNQPIEREISRRLPRCVIFFLDRRRSSGEYSDSARQAHLNL
jgi:hypothetical protein